MADWTPSDFGVDPLSAVETLAVAQATPNSIFTASTAQSITVDAESIDYLEALDTKKDRFIPHVDFATASNFAKFGSAEKYYEDAYTRIHNFYPYDGSKKEKVQWELSSSFIDRYIFAYEYPRTTGYIKTGYVDPGYALPWHTIFNFNATSDPQYIYIKGGPNPDPNSNYKLELEPGKSTTAISKANVYNVSDNRESNLKFDPTSGITVEFWLQKVSNSGDKWDAGAMNTETIFHLLNTGSDVGTDGPTVGIDRGDFRIYLSGSLAYHQEIFLGIASGTIAHTHSIDTGLSDIADSGWHHYAVVNGNSGSYNYMKLYVDGVCIGNTSALGVIDEVTGSLVAAIGALAGPVANDVVEAGAVGNSHLVSASFDEFRYWKTERNAQQIGRFYIDQVAGGTNTDTANTNLGVYYKFNEGITGDSSIDSTVLDYSGRISNGNFVGYVSTYRNTGSAMVSASVATFEFEDPIIYPTHPTVVADLDVLKEKGESYDYVNANALINNIPSWIIENDLEVGSENLANMVQIIATYLDTLYLQIEALPTLRNIKYANEKEKPFFFNQRLLADFGFNTEEILTDVSLFAYANNRDEKILFAKKLYDVKNQIYKNIYNNLTYINKTKGTIKSFRNLLRCLGIDEEILRLSVYANSRQDLRTNYRTIASKQKYIDFYNNNTANVYLNYDSANSYSYPFISGAITAWQPPTLSYNINALFPAAFSVETEVVFPQYASKLGIENNYTKAFPYYTSSIFGCSVPEVLDPTSTDTTERIDATGADASGSFRVYALRDDLTQTNPDVCFMLTGSWGSVTSSYFQDVYQNSKWNFAVKFKPSKAPSYSFISGTVIPETALTIEFQGINSAENTILNEFTVTSSFIDSHLGDRYFSLVTPKRPYIGADRQNLTGSVNYPSDAYISSLRFWLKDLTREELFAHAIDNQNYGTSHPYQNSFLFEKGSDFNFTTAESVVGEVPQMGTLALNWNFDTVTGSDSSGEFPVPDFSYGTTSDTDIPSGSYGPLSGVLSRQHIGKAINFATSNTDVVERKNIYAYRQELPDIVHSDDQVQIVDFEGEIFTRDSRPIDYFYAFEKSMYRAISEDMINLFATMKDFHNLIGEPVNRYRMRYKNMEKIRQLFFERASNTPDLDKFLEFYKWIDNSISNMLNNLIPATAPFASSARNMVESHVLERNKYRNKFPNIETQDPTPATGQTAEDKRITQFDVNQHQGEYSSISGFSQMPKQTEIGSLVQNKSRFVSSPTAIEASAERISDPGSAQQFNADYWRLNAEATNPVIATGDSTIDAARQTIRDVIKSENLDNNNVVFNDPSLGRAYTQFTVVVDDAIGQSRNSDADFVGETLRRGNTDDSSTITIDEGSTSRNILERDPLSDDQERTDASQPRSNVALTYNPVLYGKDLLPFKIFSSSVQTTYKLLLNTYFTGADITNKFADNYAQEMHEPMQGPFAETHVGGNPYRHNAPLFNNDILGDITQRSELYNLSIDSTSLALSRRSLDEIGSDYYRDHISKSPFVFKNIKTLTASFDGSTQTSRTILGNYTHDYEIVQATTAIAQRGWLRNNYEIGVNFTQSTAEVLFLTGNLNYNIYNRTGSALRKSTFVGRFSAPGSPEVLSNGYLDPASLSLSVYNNLNYRNALVRLDTNGTQFTSIEDYVYSAFRTLQTTQSLNSQLRDHTSYGGYDALTGLPSFHKIQRNVNNRLAYSGSTVITESVYDNGFVQHAIPQSDRQYTWFTASLEADGLPFGYILSTSSATFLSKSQATVDGMYQDFVGINNTYYVPLNFSTNTAELKQAAVTGLISSNIDATTNLIFIKAGNGPYGYSTWRQLAYQAGWATKAILEWQKRNNVLSVVTRESLKIMEQKVDIKNTNNPNLRKNAVGYQNIVDPVINDANKPLKVILNAAGPQGQQKIVLSVPYSNNKQSFANNEVNYLAYFCDRNLEDMAAATEDYKTLTNIYDSPGISFKNIDYSRKIYPRTQNAFLSGTRTRLNYAEVAGTGINGYGQRDFRTFWRNKLDDRLRADISSADLKDALNIFDSYITGGYNSVDDQWQNGPLSVWPLDGSSISMSSSATMSRKRTSNTGSRGSLHKGPVHSECYRDTGGGPFPVINIHQAGPRYFGTDDWMAMAPVDGGESNEVDYRIDWNIGYGPWYDSYTEYAKDIKIMGKNSSIIPEFNISDNISYYMNFPTNGDFSVELPKNFLKLHGAEITSSETGKKYNTKFFKEYSTSDFMKDFNIILNDHKSFANISTITLTCEGHKKLIPYDGFYPTTRTVQIASLLSQSYGTHITGVSTAGYATSSFTTHSAQAALQSFMQPFFAPGILYNTIKSGIAVDWPAYSSKPTMAYPFTASAESTFISSSNDFRIQFETLYDLTKLPINKKIYSVGNGLIDDYFTYNGNKVNDLYKLAMNNFLAESVNLFLKGGKLTNFVSKPMSQVSFEENKTYRMMVELEALPNTAITRGARQNLIQNHSPIINLSGTIGRPFGPAVRFSNQALSNSFSCFDLCDPAYAPYTPPYYYGKSVVTMSYTNIVNDTVTPTLAQIINGITASYTCTFDNDFIPDFSDSVDSFRDFIDTDAPAIQNVMPISASVSLFGQRILEKSEYDKYGVLKGMADPEDVTQFEQLVISTKYECPVINQNTTSGNGPRAVWTTFAVPGGPDTGVELRVIGPSDEEMQTDNVKDLREILFGTGDGFTQKTTQKIGILPDDFEKSIFEAIVAIPFLDMETPNEKLDPYLIDSPLKGGHTPMSADDHIARDNVDSRKFFKIFETGDQAASSVKDLKSKLDKYVFPPSMDFINTNAQARVMFVFEFEQKLRSSDLMMIWQGAPPTPAREITKQKSSLSIPTETNEMLAEFLKHCASNISDNSIITSTFNNLKWMVFKVKQRAKNNYSAITSDLSDDQRLLESQTGIGKDLPFSYNWPYDYCSLVELVNITTDIEISKTVAQPPLPSSPIQPPSSPNVPANKNGGNY